MNTIYSLMAGVIMNLHALMKPKSNLVHRKIESYKAKMEFSTMRGVGYFISVLFSTLKFNKLFLFVNEKETKPRRFYLFIWTAEIGRPAGKRIPKNLRKSNGIIFYLFDDSIHFIQNVQWNITFDAFVHYSWRSLNILLKYLKS